MENYFELQLPDGSIFKGTLSSDRKSFQGPAVLVKKDTSIMIGHTLDSEFDGFGAYADLAENSVYLGSFKKSEKHGYGKLVKYRTNTETRPLVTAGLNCTRDNFFDTVETWVARAKEAESNAEEKSYKMQNKFTAESDLKAILKKAKTTLEQSKERRKRRHEKTSKIWSQYTGQWKQGKRDGWGVCSFKSNDVFEGSFQSDKMHGRGQYWYYEHATCLLYVGEFFDSTFQGLGKMVFADGSTYYGSFANNQMCS
jgi:hypothetical protein